MSFAKQSAIAKALRESLENGDAIPMGLLPSQSDLALRFGTSRVTIRRVMGALEAQGLIEKRPDLGGFVARGRAMVHLPEADTDGGRVTTIAMELKSSILQHTQTDLGEVLAAKTLRERFSCSHRTLSRALALLCDQGWIERHGRSFRLAGSTGPGSKPRGDAHVVLCGSPRTFDTSNLPLSHCVRTIERLLAQQGWNPLVPVLSRDPGTLAADLPARRVAGFVLLSRGKGWASYLMRYPQAPVVFVNPGEEVLWKKGPPTSKLYHLMVDNRTAGVEVARHLWSLGHRRVAFIHFGAAVADERKWVMRRFEGMRMIFSAPGALEAFGAESEREEAGHSKKGVSTGLGGAASHLRETCAGHLPSEWIGAGLAQLHHMDGAVAAARKLSSVFTRAARQSGITAWVCANDELAGLAQAFLHVRGLSVPGRISLVGFDNSDLAFRLGLTSFDFAAEGMGAAAVRCLTHPHLFSRRPVVTLAMDGTLVVRSSTAKV